MIEMNNEQYIVNTPWFILFKLIFSNFYLNLGDKLLFFRFRREKYNFLRKKLCLLNSSFLFSLYLWIRIHGSKWMRIRPDPDSLRWSWHIIGAFHSNVVYPCLKDFLEGQNQLLFTYGVTSAGKTYTIQVTL